MNNLLLANFVGRQIGIYRDGTDLLPIVQRAPAAERVDLDNWQELQIYSPAFDRFVPLAQVARSIDVVWEDPLILRRDRKRTLTVMADHDLLGEETAAQVFERVRPKLEAIDLPLGYELTRAASMKPLVKPKSVVWCLALRFSGDVYYHRAAV